MSSMLLSATDRGMGIPVTIAIIALAAVVIAFVQVLWFWPSRRARIERRRAQEAARRAAPGSAQAAPGGENTAPAGTPGAIRRGRHRRP
jgi:hypothetical protein